MTRKQCLLLSLLVAFMLVLTSVATATAQDGTFKLAIFHNNDGESQLIDAGSELSDFGGVARFATLLYRLRTEAHLMGYNVVTLSSGDNFLAGPEFNASLERGLPPFYDTIALDHLGYDAICLGNHDFDFNPDVLVDFLWGFSRPVPYLSANLDFSQEERLNFLATLGVIAPSTVVLRKGRMIGIVGAVTDELRSIPSPRNVIVNAVQPAVQAAIDGLTAMGINIIILISHLQDIEEDIELGSQLTGVDVMIAGGGDELLANDGAILIPGDEEEIDGTYPRFTTGADGAQIPVVTTSGEYRYIGRLLVDFNDAGQVVSVGQASGPVRVAGGEQPDAVVPDPLLQAYVVAPVEASVASLAQTTIGSTEVGLNGVRSDVRTRETNQGNLIADALLWQASQLAAQFGAPAPNVAFQNGGGIRNNDTRGPGSLTELDTFDMLPFSNFVTIIPNVTRAQFKEILENAVSRVEGTSGRFAQVAGMRFVWDPAGQAQELDDDGNVTQAGTRVVSATLDDGTAIVAGGVVQPGADLVVATIDFLARGGDDYPYRDLPFTSVGVSYQQALRNYIVNALGGTVTAQDYPEGGEGRITETAPAAE